MEVEIVQKKSLNELSPEIKKTIQYLKYDNAPMQIKGSSMVRTLKYINDYDMYTEIEDPPEDPNKFIKDINTIIYNVTNYTPTYFVSGIIFQDEENKYRWNNDQKIMKKKFNKLYEKAEFVKLDFVTYEQNHFIGLDVIYYLSPQDIDDETIKRTLTEDVTKYLKEKRYFKMLKRLFAYYQITKDDENIRKLIKLFNSDVGRKYQLYNQLESVNTLYNNKYFMKKEDLKKKIAMNMKHLKIDFKDKEDIPKIMEKLEREINNESKKYIDQFKT
jgi:hypothetical protein